MRYFIPTWRNLFRHNVWYLQRGGGRPHQQTKGLGYQGRTGGQSYEEEVPADLRRLLCHPVDDTAVHDGADHLTHTVHTVKYCC